MAINFLNKVDFNQNELDKARLVNEVNDTAAGTPVDGQLYYDTTLNVVKVGEGGAWVSISGDITKVEPSVVDNQIGISVVNPTGPIPKVGLDITGSDALGGTANVADQLMIYDADVDKNKKVTVANLLAAAPQGDVTAVEPSALVAAKGISVTSQSGPVPIVGLDAVGLTALNTTPAATDSLIIYDLSTTENKKVTVANLKLATETLYDLTTAPTGTAVRLTDAAGSDDVTISGTAGRTAMSRINASELRVDLTDDVTIINDATIGNDLTVNGVIIQTEASAGSPAAPLNTFAGQVQVPTATAGGNAPNLAQVELLVAGVGVFQGPYDATNDPGSPNISGGSNVALDQGDYFVVTVDGDITFSDTVVTVEVGDFIFANAGITASSTPASTQYTFVIADANLATAGTLTGAQRGVAGFDATTFNVTQGAGNDPGFVTLKTLANPYGAKVLLTSGVTSGGQTTFTVDIEALFTQTGATADPENCTAEIIRIADLLTVYPEVSRNGTGDMLFKFIPAVADDLFKALITIV